MPGLCLQASASSVTLLREPVLLSYKTLSRSPETETAEDYYVLLQEVCADSSRRHNVEGLGKQFRARLEKVVEKEGDGAGN